MSIKRVFIDGMQLQQAPTVRGNCTGCGAFEVLRAGPGTGVAKCAVCRVDQARLAPRRDDTMVIHHRDNFNLRTR